MATDHAFTDTIRQILREQFGDISDTVLERSPLLQYLNMKTRSAGRGSKSRGSFANHYALYVLVEDYIKEGFGETSSANYADYVGAKFTDLFRRQRELPFGAKLQNHALNHRLNEEFRKYFPTVDVVPILRETNTSRYWVNENLLIVDVDGGNTVNIARAVIAIVDAYVDAKRSAFEKFIKTCQELSRLRAEDAETANGFVTAQLNPKPSMLRNTFLTSKRFSVSRLLLLLSPKTLARILGSDS